MKEKFREIHLSKKNKEMLARINDIIEEYKKQGYKLTLRQLYYQLVTANVIPNKQSEYAKLSHILGEGRMAGIVDWYAIEDRVRVPKKLSTFESPKEILEAALQQFRLDSLKNQESYIEVWVEKDALSGVLSRITNKYRINILVNRGYSSISAMYESYKRILFEIQQGKTAYILYLGDHDPSGKDMIRDITERLTEFLYNCSEFHTYYCGTMFTEDEETEEAVPSEYYSEIYEKYGISEMSNEEYQNLDLKRLMIADRLVITPVALTTEQIKFYQPPPNPAKVTDPRAEQYIREHGEHSWEVDALKPEVLNRILDESIRKIIDTNLLEEMDKLEREGTLKLKTFVKSFE